MDLSIVEVEALPLVGRTAELQRLCEVLAADCDVVIAGVPGIGRHRLLRSAAQRLGAVVVEIDCLRSTDYRRFLRLLGEAILRAFGSPEAVACMAAWCQGQPLRLIDGQFVWAEGQDWDLLRALVTLPQVLAQALGCRVVLMFQNFPHMASWDRQGKWQAYLQEEIRRQQEVSYALIETSAVGMERRELQVLSLGPLERRDLRAWLVGLGWEGAALELFLDYVQGHFADALALGRRLTGPPQLIEPERVTRAALALVADLSVTFESLILLLPNTQVRVLESLAIDPTPRPHAADYIRRHHLSRGGTLQGALASLEQKGLLYGAAQGYRIALPMLALWLQQRLG